MICLIVSIVPTIQLDKDRSLSGFPQFDSRKQDVPSTDDRPEDQLDRCRPSFVEDDLESDLLVSALP